MPGAGGVPQMMGRGSVHPMMTGSASQNGRWTSPNRRRNNKSPSKQNRRRDNKSPPGGGHPIMSGAAPYCGVHPMMAGAGGVHPMMAGAGGVHPMMAGAGGVHPMMAGVGGVPQMMGGVPQMMTGSASQNGRWRSPNRRRGNK